MGQALLYFGAVVYAAWAMMRILGSRRVFVVVLIMMLLIPIFYGHVMQHLLRDTFYSAVVLLYFAMLLELLFGPGRRPRFLRATACGLVLGVVWLTREERQSIIPASLLAIGAVLWRERAMAWIAAEVTSRPPWLSPWR